MVFLSVAVVTICVGVLQPILCQTNISQDIFFQIRPPFKVRSTRTEVKSDDFVEEDLTYPYQKLPLKNKEYLRDAFECKNYTVLQNEVWTIRPLYTPNPVNCLQNFETSDDSITLKMMCHEVKLRFSCKIEFITIRTNTTTIKLCEHRLREWMPPITGKTISLNYVRKTFSLYGNYICFIQTAKLTNQQIKPSDPPVDIKTTSRPLMTSNFTNCFNCGKSQDILLRFQGPQIRILGGSKSDPGKFPFMAYLRLKERGSLDVFVCGGSLISKRVILTAAHCLDFDIMKIEVILGTINPGDANAKIVSTTRFAIHPDYDNIEIINDIGLIFLDPPIEFTELITPICLPTENIVELGGLNGTVAGWGKTENKMLSTSLQYVDLNILFHDECKRIWKNMDIDLQDNQICASGNKKDSCSGDSGGPLFIKFNDKWVIIGIVSYGVGCAHEIYPGVYTRVSSFMPYIREHVELCM